MVLGDVYFIFWLQRRYALFSNYTGLWYVLLGVYILLGSRASLILDLHHHVWLDLLKEKQVFSRVGKWAVTVDGNRKKISNLAWWIHNVVVPSWLTVATLIPFRALKLTIACAKLLMTRGGWGVGARGTKYRMMMCISQMIHCFHFVI
jgi:hypothetical protein